MGSDREREEINIYEKIGDERRAERRGERIRAGRSAERVEKRGQEKSRMKIREAQGEQRGEDRIYTTSSYLILILLGQIRTITLKYGKILFI